MLGIFNPTVVAAVVSLICAVPVHAQNASLPVVDLGYELHQASFYNVRLQVCHVCSHANIV